jgi:glycosyltransferase involved in cell wall biosynthesis
MSKKISVIMSVYNDTRFLKESINSILNQSFSDFEFIIINDGSNKFTKKILISYKKKDKRIILLNQRNKGLTNSLNAGLKICNGELIARQDSDDISYKERFTEQINLFNKNKEIVLCGSFANLINEKNQIIKSITNIPTNDLDIKKKLFNQNIFIHSSTMYKLNIMNKIGGYNNNFKYAQDYECWCRMSTEGNFANIPNKLIALRVHSQSISATKRKEQNYYALKAKIFLNSKKIINKKKIDEFKNVMFYLNKYDLEKKNKKNTFFDLNRNEKKLVFQYPKLLINFFLKKLFNKIISSYN